MDKDSAMEQARKRAKLVYPTPEIQLTLTLEQFEAVIGAVLGKGQMEGAWDVFRAASEELEAAGVPHRWRL